MGRLPRPACEHDVSLSPYGRESDASAAGGPKDPRANTKFLLGSPRAWEGHYCGRRADVMQASLLIRSVVYIIYSMYRDAEIRSVPLHYVFHVDVKA